MLDASKLVFCRLNGHTHMQANQQHARENGENKNQERRGGGGEETTTEALEGGKTGGGKKGSESSKVACHASEEMSTDNNYDNLCGESGSYPLRDTPPTLTTKTPGPQPAMLRATHLKEANMGNG